MATAAERNPFNKNQFPNCHAGYDYALQVVDKKIPACVYVIGACKRAIREINNAYHPDWMFVPERAEKYLRVVQRFHHVTGHWPIPNIIYEPWQCFIWMNIQGFVNRHTRMRRFRYAHIEIPRGNAKALALDTMVPTPDRGLVEFGTLDIGDLLYDSRGEVCRITNRNQVHRPQAFRVHFSDNTAVECSDEHLWVTSTKEERGRGTSSVKTTKQIFNSVKIGKESNHSIELARAVQGEGEVILPYVLGYWLGNGDSRSGRFSTHEDYLDEVVSKFKSKWIDIKTPTQTGKGRGFTATGLTFWLRELGVVNNKHIPEKYFLASETDRRELLRGLLDSDGTVDRAGAVSFCSANKGLAFQVRRLAASLGYKVTLSEKKTKAQNGFEGVAYYVNFTAPNTRPDIFSLSKKEGKRKDAVRGRKVKYATKRYITKVEKISKRDMFCIEVDSPDNTFLVTDQYIPTHNSTMSSQCLLYELCLDNPNGNTISTVASKKDQAEIVLGEAQKMARKNKGFLKKTGVDVRAKEILHPPSNSRARAMSSDAEGLDGLNDNLAVCDELHAMSREVFGTITSGMSKRTDSLVLSITTAGSSTDCVGFEESILAKKICTGEYADDTRFAIVYTVDPDDDIYDEKTWRKANPNWGVSVDPVTFRSKVMKTKEVPADLPNVKIKHLNMWTEGAESYFSVDRWDLCADKSLTWDKFKGKTCMAAIDLSQVTDLSAKIFVFKDDEGRYVFMDKVYVAEETVGSKNAVDKYAEWIKDGWLIQMPGAAIDYIQFGDELKEDLDTFDVRQCAYDPWNATEMSQRLSEYVEMVEFRQGARTFSEPMKKFDALIRQQKIVHRGSPLMRWALSNVVAKEDNNGNVFPKKLVKRNKIDPIVASIMALALWLQEQETGSMYESEGFRSF